MRTEPLSSHSGNTAKDLALFRRSLKKNAKNSENFTTEPLLLRLLLFLHTRLVNFNNFSANTIQDFCISSVPVLTSTSVSLSSHLNHEWPTGALQCLRHVHLFHETRSCVSQRIQPHMHAVLANPCDPCIQTLKASLSVTEPLARRETEETTATFTQRMVNLKFSAANSLVRVFLDIAKENTDNNWQALDVSYVTVHTEILGWL